MTPRSTYRDRVLPRSVFLIMILVAVVIIPSIPAQAATVESDLVLIRSDDVVDEDLYAIANQAEIAGTVQGDLVVAAAGEVKISGLVEGDVLVFASSVVVTGVIGGSLRTVSRSLSVTGEVGDDIFAIGADFEMAGSSGRDLLIWALEASVAGSVGRDLDGQQRHLVLDGSVLGDVDVAASSLVVGPKTVVDGDLRYVSERSAEVSTESEIRGQLIHATPLAPNVRIRGLRLLMLTLSWLAMLAIGLALLWAVPHQTVAAGRTLRSAPWKAALAGALSASFPFLLLAGGGAVLGAISPEAALPLLAVLLPVVLAAFGLLGLALLVAMPPVSIAIGGMLMPGRSHHAQLVVGALIVGPIVLLPWVGGWLWAVAGLVGLGAWVVSIGSEAVFVPEPS